MDFGVVVAVLSVSVIVIVFVFWMWTVLQDDADFDWLGTQIPSVKLA